MCVNNISNISQDKKHTYSYDSRDRLIGEYDQDGNIVWKWEWESTPFGEIAPTGSLEFNLRFAGQYYDNETGTHYNINRDYNPVTGRYIQSDPIGLDGGFSTFAYVNGNPVMLVDLEGLCLSSQRKKTYTVINRENFNAENNMAVSALTSVLSQSIREHREYTGVIYVIGSSAFYTNPRKNSKAKGELHFEDVPTNGKEIAYYHTHGGKDRGYNGEIFSSEDLAIADEYKINAYVATPSRRILIYKYKIKTIFELIYK